MTTSFLLTPLPTFRRSVGSILALAAALTLGLQPSLAVAQSVESDASVQSKPKPSAHAKRAPKKKVSKRMPSDTVAEDLNRREAERAARFVQGMTSAAPIASTVERNVDSTEPPTAAAIPRRAPIASASLTPDLSAERAGAPATQMAIPLEAQTPRQFAQTPPPAPSPVPIQPPAAGVPRQAPTVMGAPGRGFGQSQVVPTQQPTLSLEVNKGTAVKLPGPAATVFVAAPDIADVQVKSPGMIYVFAKKPGDTVLYAVDDQDRVLLNTIVSVSSPVSRMKSTLDRLHPGNGVVIENQGESIVLGGTVRSALIAEDARRIALQHVNGQASKVISNIVVDAPTQVQLRVKIAEVRRDALKRVGVDWRNINNVALFGTTGQLGVAVNTVTAIGGVNSSGAVAYRASSGTLDALVDFLATQNQATILAEPNLIAMSGETASFLAGGEIPLITPQSGANNNTILITYKQVGVSLAFTPTIIGDRINLKVAPEVSQLSSIGSISVPLTATAVVTIPGIQTRKASTTIELGSGQSFAIAGLLQASSQHDITKLPWLGDIPVLGSLFKSDAYQRSESELVIIITPFFVEPTSDQLRTPLTGRVPPTDADRLLYQRLDHPTPPRRVTVGRERYAGPSAGFKLD
jgi:Flp pilus assembly secretin CpaC